MAMDGAAALYSFSRVGARRLLNDAVTLYGKLSGWAPGVPADSMIVPWRLQKGGKLITMYYRVVHGGSRCGIDLSRDST